MVLMKRSILLLAVCVLVSQAAPAQIIGPTVIQGQFLGTSPALVDLAAAAATGPVPLLPDDGLEVPNQIFEMPNQERGQLGPLVPLMDPVRQTVDGLFGTPAPTLSFQGTGDDDNLALLGFRIVPPDTEGDVGKDYYAQMNNLVFEIFN